MEDEDVYDDLKNLFDFFFLAFVCQLKRRASGVGDLSARSGRFHRMQEEDHGI